MKIETFSSMSEVLRTYYARKNLHTNIHQKSANLRQVITTLLDRNRKKLAIQKKQMADTDKMDKYRIYGELLHTYGYQAKEGDKSLTCINYYDNQKITIPLDHTLSAMENAEKYFNKYNKLKRTRSSLDVYIKETEDAIDHLTSMLTALTLASDQADLDEVHDELSDYGYIHKRVRKKGQDSKSKPLHYITEDGYHIYVGKNNHQNDYLTFKLATGNDWWFHTKKIHGSHVIVQPKTENFLIGFLRLPQISQHIIPRAEKPTVWRLTIFRKKTSNVPPAEFPVLLFITLTILLSLTLP